MSRLLPAGFALSPDELPRAKLDADKVRARLLAAGIVEGQHPAIVAALQQAMDGYCLDRLGESYGATPAEVRAYIKAVGEAVQRLCALTATRGPRASRVGKALLDRAYISGALPPGFADDLTAIMGRLVSGLASAGGATADGKSINGKAAVAARHRKLATAFLDMFAEREGWPLDLNGNGLMCQLFGLCLDSVGESQVRPQRVFLDAAETMIADSARH
jgi:hypothetical protein